MSLATQATNTYTGSVTNPLSTGEKIVLLRYEGTGINSTPTQIDNVTMTSTTTFSYSDVVSGGTYTYQWAKVNVFGQAQPFADYRVYDTAAPTVTLKQDANNDGVITAAEAGAGADKLTVEIGIPSRAMKGDSILVDNGSGSVETVTLTQADINNGTITVQIDTPADGNTANITAKFEDVVSVNGAGSTTVNGNDSAVVDVNVPGDSNGDGVADKGPVVTISEDANNDGVITAGELQGDIDVSVAMPVNTSVGDTLVLTINGTTQNVTVTQAIINNGYTFTVPNAGQGASVNVEAYVQDAVGQTSLTGSDTATLNLQTVGTPSIDIVAVDDIVNDSESQAGVTVSGSGTAGNTLTLTDGSGNVLGTTIITAGGTWQLPLTLAQVQAMGQGDETLTATASDNYGGSAAVTHGIEVDTIAPDAPSNVEHSGNQVTGSAEANSTVIVKDSSGNVLGTATADNNGSFAVNLSQSVAVGTSLNVTATDVAGNESAITGVGYDNVVKVYTDASSWNDNHGPLGYHYGYETTDGNDWLQIGNGAKNCWTFGTQGNIWNHNPAAGWAVIETGEGNDRIDTGYGGGTGSMFAYTGVETGAGNDIFNLKGDMVNNNYVIMGDGDDSMNVGGFMGTYTSVNMGEGDDNLNIGTDMLSGSRVSTGAGDDTFSMGGLMTLNSSVDLGSGDDVAIYDHKTLDGHIDGGVGNDKLVLTHNDSDAPVAWWNWSNITGTHTGNIKGFETIEMKGIMALDVRYSDLLTDSSREGALFIQGDSKSKVDLGATNWNSDTTSRQNLSDVGGGTWEQTGTEVVGGISYDVYHHSSAGSSTDNDVYIQNGIAII